jgi:hypothetical protein
MIRMEHWVALEWDVRVKEEEIVHEDELFFKVFDSHPEVNVSYLS